MRLDYTLMHREVPVCDLTMEDGFVLSLGRPHDSDHAPMGTVGANGYLNVSKLRFWLDRRSIPNARARTTETLELLGFTNPASAVEASLALSLSDTYWLKPEGSHVGWHDVNLFENDFESVTAHTHQRTPNPQASTSGEKPKRWLIAQDGRRCLEKRCTGPSTQQVANEVIAHVLARQMEIEHVGYRLAKSRKSVICQCMCSENVEYVCAYDILESQRFPTGRPDNAIKYLREQYRAHGLDFDRAASDMTLIDVAIRNEDRHWSNFGILRDATTNEWLRPAPLFDFGDSLWFSGDEQTREPQSRFSGRLLIDDLAFVTSVTQPQLDAIGMLPKTIRHVFDIAGLTDEHADFVTHATGDRVSRIRKTLETRLTQKGATSCQNSQTALTGYMAKSKASTRRQASGASSRTSTAASAPSSRARCRSSTSTAKTAAPLPVPSSAPTPSAEFEVT